MMKRQKVKILLELCDPEARVPSYARPGDAGMDIYAVEDMVIEPGSTVVLRTGIKVAIPNGYEIQIRPRSGLSLKTPLRLPNSPGTIDAGYRDEIGIIMQNTSTSEPYHVKKGERIAQMVLQRVPAVEWQLTQSVSGIGEDRGGGFGSSGS
ncbi:MAG: dUTP diphosphatase [Peptococcaceae bacterium]|nr:dUTP diphosphatase [Peptococcaceae bacterium]MDH7525230.1 dUTP diphosphatase [Peptococcaceae bacterium]